MADPMGREETVRKDIHGIDHWYVWELEAGKCRGRTLRVGNEFTFIPYGTQKIRARFKEARKSEAGYFNVIEATGVNDGVDYLLCAGDILTVHRTVTPSPHAKAD